MSAMPGSTDSVGSDQPQPNRAPTVLIVEDDVLIRMSIADYLRDCGYHVIEAGNGDEAVTVMKTDTEVDVVFSDVMMPGSIDGFSLAKWIRQERPCVRIILTSGVAKSAREARDLCDDGPLVGKPYDHRAVESRIRALLASRDGA